MLELSRHSVKDSTALFYVSKASLIVVCTTGSVPVVRDVLRKIIQVFVTCSRTTTPMIGNLSVPSLSTTYPPPPPPVLPTPPAPPPPAPQAQPPPSMQMSATGPRFSFHDINHYSISTLQSHINVKMEVGGCLQRGGRGSID